MPDNILASIALAPTGETLLTPALSDFAHNGYRIVLEGVFQFKGADYFDAVYRLGPDGSVTDRHNYLTWTPQAPTLEELDTARHRYVFRVPAAWRLDGQSVGVKVDIDRLVDETLDAQELVRSELGGSVTMSVVQTPLGPASFWPMVGWAAVPAVILLGGVGWVVRRRMAFQGLSPDLVESLARVEGKYRAACAALGRSPGSRAALQERLSALGEGAYALVRQIQELRNAQKLADRRMLETEIAGLQQRLADCGDEALRTEAEKALAEKRKTLAALDEIARAESRCAMRLVKIEAVLDATCLTLRGASAQVASVPAEEALCRELDAEVSAIREVAREVPAAEALPLQTLHR